MSIKNSIGQKLLLAFEGNEPSPEIKSALKDFKPGGLVLFRHSNIVDPLQVRKLTASLQQLAKEFDLPPLFIATDQEGGQLTAIAEGTTPLPGNMALGAVGSIDLARKAGAVLGRELAAMGVNIDFAPVCDININPQNPVIGIRSFGENPEKVAWLAAAMVEGIQSAGVAATAKHFPGHGDTEGDSHHGLFFIPHDLSRLQSVELKPFQATVNADVKLIMTAHLALPAIDGQDAPPATLSRNILHGLLREQMDYDGLIVTDALDMKAVSQNAQMGDTAVAASIAGADLLLLSADQLDPSSVFDQLVRASHGGRLSSDIVSASLERIISLKSWFAKYPQPDLDVVGCTANRAVANEIAERSITLVRNEDGLLPLTLKPEQRVAVIVPEPVDLTPADTSSYVKLELARAIQNHHSNLDEYVISYAPSREEITRTIDSIKKYDLLVIGTLNAFASPNQASFIRQALKLGLPTVVVALRLPYDLVEFPEARTYVCTYSILEPSMKALAKALFGEIDFQGQLPVSIPGLFDVGYAANLWDATKITTG
ncbi:MAG: glycoside hydrolase family 3 N-terminal domain-containing protein [Anaerolineales bacterium]